MGEVGGVSPSPDPGWSTFFPCIPLPLTSGEDVRHSSRNSLVLPSVNKMATRDLQWLLSVIPVMGSIHPLNSVDSMGTWVAQSVKCLTSAQVLISWSVSSSPASGSVLTAQSLEPVSDSVSPSLSLSLSLCPSTAHALSLSVSVKNKH